MPVYFAANRAIVAPAGGGTLPSPSTPLQGNAMGDRSPKSTQKNASQKQARTDVENQRKQNIITAQQATKTKAAAARRK